MPTTTNLSETHNLPNPPTMEELLWALSTVMDGVTEHEIVSMTGISEEDASRVNRIASRAIQFSLANGLY